MTIISVVPSAIMKFKPLPDVLIYLSIPLLYLWHLAILSFSCVLRVRVSLALLLQWIRRSRVSLVLLSKFLLDFDSIPIGRSK